MKSQKNGVSRMTHFSHPVQTVSSFYNHANFAAVTKPQSTLLRLSSVPLSYCTPNIQHSLHRVAIQSIHTYLFGSTNSPSDYISLWATVRPAAAVSNAVCIAKLAVISHQFTHVPLSPSLLPSLPSWVSDGWARRFHRSGAATMMIWGIFPSTISAFFHLYCQCSPRNEHTRLFSFGAYNVM